MGINHEWPRIWKAEGDSYIEKSPRVRTIFIDGQIMLMKAQVADGSTWADFVKKTFIRKLLLLHNTYDNIILSFDNYENVPVYKSIEQLRRTANAQNTFRFSATDLLPSSPPTDKVWSAAMLNRTFKTHVISLVSSMIVAEYTPLRRHTTLVVDFVNVVRIDFGNKDRMCSTLPDLVPMGESDVKFMRYASIFGDLLVDSIDSDVLLISMLLVQRLEFTRHVFVRRYESVSIDMPASDKKRKQTDSRSTKTYEIINIQALLLTMHDAARQAVGSEVQIAPQHMTYMLVYIFLLGGSDFSRKVPYIGTRLLWESLHISIPALLMTSSVSENGSFVVDNVACADIVFTELYKQKYDKHTRHAGLELESVLNCLQESSLSELTKRALPTREQLLSTCKNISWIIDYWSYVNSNPPTCEDGTHGFTVKNGKVFFADNSRE